MKENNVKGIFMAIRCLLLIGILAFSGHSASHAKAEDNGLNLYLYHAETQTMIIKDHKTDITEEIANGYQLLSYEDAKDATVRHGIIGEGEPFLLYDFLVNILEDVETLELGDDVSNSFNFLTYYCSNLKSITIGDGMTDLKENFFSQKSQITGTATINSTLETIVIGKSVQTIGDSAFEGCIGLKNIVVDPENPYLKIADKGLYSADGKKLYAYPVAADSEPVIAPGTETINSAVFAYSHMKSIEIPASVTALSARLFEHCEQLEKFTFAANSQCVRTDYSSIKTGYSVKYKKGIFEGCKRLKEVRFGEDFQILAADTFYDSAVRSVYFGKSFQDIEDIYKKSEKNFLCYDSPEKQLVFPNIEKIEIAKQNPYFKVKNAALLSKDGKILYYYPVARNKKSYTVPASVETIAEGAFYKNQYLQNIHIGKNTKKIKTGAFKNCKNLKKVTLGKKVKRLCSDAFTDCHKLTTIVNLEKIISAGSSLSGTKIIYMPEPYANYKPEITRGKVMYFYAQAEKTKTTWHVIKGANRVKILKRYKNPNRIKVKFQKKGSAVIQVKQGKDKINYKFQIK